MGNIKKPTSLSKNPNPTQGNMYGRRFFTEEQENNFVNKVAEKIFTAIKYNPNAVPIKPPVQQPVEPIKLDPIGGDNLSNINKNFDEWLSNFDNEEKNKKAILDKSKKSLSKSKKSEKKNKSEKTKISEKSKKSGITKKSKKQSVKQKKQKRLKKIKKVN